MKYVVIIIVLVMLPTSLWAASSENYQLSNPVSEGGGVDQTSTNYQLLVIERSHSIDFPSSTNFIIKEGPIWESFVGIAPTIVSFYPADGALNILPEAKIAVSFDSDMNTTSVQNAFTMKAIYDNQNNSTDLTVSGSFNWPTGRAVTFEPSSLLNKGYTYRITISKAAEDLERDTLVSGESWTFRAIFDHTIQNIFQSSDGNAKVDLGVGAVAQDGWIDINRDPINNPKEIDPNSIILANNKVIAEGNPYHYPLTSTITEYNTYDSSGNRITDSFGAPVTITLYYDDADNDGVVDGTSPQIQERGLLIYRLDEANSLWVRMPGSTVNTVQDYVTASVPSFGVFTLMSTAALSLSDAYSFPNPYKPSEGHTQITFTNLSAVCTIKIFTLTGDHVKTIIENDGDGQASWDVLNESGEGLASGLYLYIIKSAQDQKAGKLVIIK